MATWQVLSQELLQQVFHEELLSQLHVSWLQVSGCPWSSGAWSDGDKKSTWLVSAAGGSILQQHLRCMLGLRHCSTWWGPGWCDHQRTLPQQHLCNLQETQLVTHEACKLWQHAKQPAASNRRCKQGTLRHGFAPSGICNSCRHGACRDRTIDLTAQISAHSITWVSEQLMKGRNSGNYGNYGERLYVEGLMELEKRRAAVRA